MKRTFFFLIVLMINCSAFSQEGLGWKFSVSFDPMLTWGSASEAIESKGSRMGFNFSLHADKYFKERYAFYVGASIMNMGGKIRNITDDPIAFKTSGMELLPQSEAKIRAYYLSIPVGLKFKTPDYGLLSYYFNAGLFTGVRLSGSCNIEGKSKSITKDFNFMTAGLQLGLGTMYATGDNTYLQGGLIFNYSFVDVLRSSNMSFKPIGLGLHLGFIF